MKKLFIASAIAVALSAAAITPALGQGSILVPDGDEITCTLTCEGEVIVVGYDPDGNGVVEPFWTNGSGNASFISTGNTQVPVPSATFTASSMTLTGNDANLGNFTFNFDASRPAPNTTIVANQPGSEFPASVNVYANVSGTIDGLAGTYINRTTCHMTATINSFNPQNNEQYSFVSDVEFIEDNGDPNAPTAFVIPANSDVRLR